MNNSRKRALSDIIGKVSYITDYDANFTLVNTIKGREYDKIISHIGLEEFKNISCLVPYGYEIFENDKVRDYKY